MLYVLFYPIPINDLSWEELSRKSDTQQIQALSAQKIQRQTIF